MTERPCGSRPVSKCRVLLADGRAGRAQRLVTALAASAAVAPEAVAQTLTEAYNITENLAPDAVAISADLAVRPEFPMYRALLDAMKLRYFVYGGGAAGLPQLASVLQVPMAEGGDPAALMAGLQGCGALGGAGSRRSQPALVVIGASTGGIEALETVLAAFPADAPPTLIVQHIRGEFSASVASRLDRATPVSVREARDGAPLEPGCAWLAPGNALHLEVTGRAALRCRLRAGPAVSGHRPSIDVLFRSAASVGQGVVGVLLTGMGRDGAEGLLAIRRAGGMTIAQDRASCVVYGMPRAAAEIDAVDRELPLPRIAAAILQSGAPRGRALGEATAR